MSIKDISYYRWLPYPREWIPRSDDSGCYFVVQSVDIPEIYGTGATKADALKEYFLAFDDQIDWMLEMDLEIPEPEVATTPPEKVERIFFSEPVGDEILFSGPKEGSRDYETALWGARETVSA